MKVLIAAGGSGGHIFPAVALAGALKDKGAGTELKFVGGNKELDKRIFEKDGLKYSLLSSNKMPYRMGFGTLIFLVKLFFDAIKSFFIVAAYRPDIVVGFGGYVAAPVILSSYILRVPNVIHEQNVIPGRANKFLFNIADKIALSFSETLKLLEPDIAKKSCVTGNPIRTKNFKDDKDGSLAKYGLGKNRFTILLIGGSRGSHFLNETFIDALSGMDDATKSALQIIHITGIKDYDWAMREYRRLGVETRVYSFIDRIEEAYSASDLVVTRSGASAVFELAFFGKPMLLVPYPLALGHQIENAKVFSKNGAAIEIDQNNLTGEVFKGHILKLINDRDTLGKMGEAARKLSMPRASDNLADMILNLC